VRSLSPDEAELWGRVAATIRPLSREKLPDESPEMPRQTPGPSPAPAEPPSPPPQRRAPAIPIAQQTLDGSWDKKLRTGALEPERTVDLHDMNLDTAWAAIDRSLEQAIARGDRIILLITGHHRPGEPPVQRGRLRAAVHDWLAASRHASNIAAVRGAHRRHGGGGSLYLILRRNSARR
jgi:DNA-nicking Smr family endonuclease